MAGAMPLTQYTWSNDSVFELIDMVKERPVLWDSSRDDHRDRVKKQAAWREIADHFGLDKTVVEKKMRMMIGQYRREMNRIAGGDTSKWFAFQKLSFLSGMQVMQDTIATVHVGSGGHNNILQNNNDLVEERSSMPMYCEEDYSEDSMSCQKPLAFAPSIEPPVKRPRLEVKRPQEAPMTSIDAVIKMLYDEKNSRDEFVVFGEYVANKLRNVQSQHARNTAQYHINNILYKAETGQFEVFKPGREPGKSSGRAELPVEGGGAARWENESVTSLADSVDEGNQRVECVQIKMEK